MAHVNSLHSLLTINLGIPFDFKREIREHLDQAQINERVLLPRLDGLAAFLHR